MPTVFFFSSSERLGELLGFFLTIWMFSKEKCEARKLFQTKENIAKCWTTQWNISGFLLFWATLSHLPPKKNPQRGILRLFSLHVFFIRRFFLPGKCFWELLRGAGQITGAAGQLVAVEREWAGRSLYHSCVSLPLLSGRQCSVIPGKATYLNTRIDKGMRIPSSI